MYLSNWSSKTSVRVHPIFSKAMILLSVLILTAVSVVLGILGCVEMGVANTTKYSYRPNIHIIHQHNF